MALISNDGGPDAIALLLILNSHNSQIGSFVGCVRDSETLNYAIKSSNGSIMIPRAFFEKFTRDQRSISVDLFKGLANRFVTEK